MSEVSAVGFSSILKSKSTKPLARKVASSVRAMRCPHGGDIIEILPQREVQIDRGARTHPMHQCHRVATLQHELLK